MTPDKAKLALDALHAAGSFSRVAWDKLCFYYQVEAITALALTLVVHGAITAALVYSARKPWWDPNKDEPQRWLFCSVVLAIVWIVSLLARVADVPRLVATAAAPEIPAAQAVAGLVRGAP